MSDLWDLPELDPGDFLRAADEAWGFARSAPAATRTANALAADPARDPGDFLRAVDDDYGFARSETPARAVGLPCDDCRGHVPVPAGVITRGTTVAVFRCGSGGYATYDGRRR